jgi:hypothetical protein
MKTPALAGVFFFCVGWDGFEDGASGWGLRMGLHPHPVCKTPSQGLHLAYALRSLFRILETFLLKTFVLFTFVLPRSSVSLGPSSFERPAPTRLLKPPVVTGHF